MRWHELSETPIDLHTIDYPDVEGRPDSFRPDDRGLFRSTKGVEKIKKVWHSSVADVVCYVVNIGHQPEKALDIATYGHDLAGENGNVGDLWELDIQPAPDKITVMFTNNEGARRYPLTGWMIAHRMFHSFAFTRDGRYHGGENIQPVNDQLNRLMEQFSAVMGDIRSIYNPSLGIIDCAQEVGTTKACRDKNLNTSAEFMPEHFAQFMLKGAVRLNPMPEKVRSTNDIFYTCTQGNYTYCNEEVAEFERWLNIEFGKLVQLCKGRIFAI
jgi:hypothetical protein